jgi:hypothetical protein
MKKEVHPDKFLYVEEMPNYIVQKINRNPSDAVKYRREEIYDKHGYRHLLTVAVRKGGKTVVTSIWHPKDEPKARKLKELARKKRKLKRRRK